MLTSIGVETGDVVGVMDWDTTRFLELFNAIPMSGSVIHTINVRLSPDQVLYTINHAEDKILFVNEEFIPIIPTLSFFLCKFLFHSHYTKSHLTFQSFPGKKYKAGDRL